jgi:hypothetical protein
VSSTFGPVSASSDPALINLPKLSISSIGGVAVPTVPTGSYTTADLALPTQTLSAVPVIVTATNTPLNTTYVVRVVPNIGNATSFNAAPAVGTPALSTATAQVTLPSGQVSVLNAYAALTLTPLTARLFPVIEGEEIEQVLLAAVWGGPSSTTLVMKSGREVPVAALLGDEQIRIARALAALNTEQDAGRKEDLKP